ncbi:MAG: hypothetical protein KatS3mg068_1552 [Candidatus Sericytochromatia bacterium]|nr:MAG: hypothetical protein KatS3mg068_1552 [Candidatus Sericytochromatia bacterium]
MKLKIVEKKEKPKNKKIKKIKKEKTKQYNINKMLEDGNGKIKNLIDMFDKMASKMEARRFGHLCWYQDVRQDAILFLLESKSLGIVPSDSDVFNVMSTSLKKYWQNSGYDLQDHIQKLTKEYIIKKENKFDYKKFLKMLPDKELKWFLGWLIKLSIEKGKKVKLIDISRFLCKNFPNNTRSSDPVLYSKKINKKIQKNKRFFYFYMNLIKG